MLMFSSDAIILNLRESNATLVGSWHFVNKFSQNKITVLGQYSELNDQPPEYKLINPLNQCSIGRRK